MVEYAIVIPSRNRVGSAARALKLLPRAIVYVDEREEAAYRAQIPAEQLRLHKPTRSLPEVRNLLIGDFVEPVLIQVDDDLRGVRFMHNGKRGAGQLITDPKVIIDVIENGIQVAEDAGVGVFGWTRNANPMHYAGFDPIQFVQPMFGTYGVRGPARHRRFDTGVTGRADTDFVLQTLLEDRIIFCDRRFYFDHGAIFTGKGGNVDLIDEELYQRSTRIVSERWAPYVILDKPSFGSGNRNARSQKQGVKIRVRRRSPSANK